MLKRWSKKSTETILKNDYWSYKLDKFTIEDSFEGRYHYVHTLGSTMVIPIIADKKIILVNQYRYLSQKESLEFPCGSVKENLSLEENAQKELREESGYSAGKLIHAGKFSPYTGASDEMCTVFIGLELTPSPLPKDDTEDFEIVKMSFEELNRAIETNYIWDGLTLSAWSLAKRKLMKLTD